MNYYSKLSLFECVSCVHVNVKCVYNLYLFIPVTCMCLNQVCETSLTVTQHFIFPISSVITKAI